MSKKIIFDLGNVLFPLDYEELEDWLKTTVEVMTPEFKLRFDQMYIDYESGHFDTQTYFEKLRRELGMTFDDEMFRQKWVSIWKQDNTEVHELLHELKQKHILHCLSNTNEMHIQEYMQHRPIMKIFDHNFFSHELKAAKPTPEIYRKVQAALAVAPEQIVFFDDRKENVHAALKEGWQAFLFIDAAGVRRDLERMRCL